MIREPFLGQGDDLIQCPGLLEEVSCARHHREPLLAFEPSKRRLVELQDRGVEAADDQRGRRPHLGERIFGEIGPSATRDDGADFGFGQRIRHQGAPAPVLAPK